MSCIILDDEALKYSEASLRVGIHPRSNTGHSRMIRNANDLHLECEPKAMADEEEDEDDEEETDGSSEEYNDTNSSIRVTLEQMQIGQTQHSDALVDIHDILQLGANAH
ncbi:hypothetical protein M9H77_03724 [Catharanthus roseus]|uniref:Uncharacterized protein n=1 Tax=Catharanthus roseus TaxID=4058 RepID=A0ACC0CCI9_CATRO|nr:hypothetical protein M9H77_03724 [Catharanthus roseus]